MIKTAGVGYTLLFVGRSASLNLFAFVSSIAFDVTVGDVYMTAFSKFVGTATGGIPFSPNPIVIAVDRGGNLINTVNNAFVTAYLIKSPTGNELLKPANMLTVQFYSGVATFQQLYLNETGSPYQIGFVSTLVCTRAIKWFYYIVLFVIL